MDDLRGAVRRLGPVPVAFFGIVVLAAGASGAALLVAPGSTDRYFSWTLRPPGAAALIGGFYLASAAVFAWGLTLSGREARALLVGVLGLAVPTLVLTLIHNEVFNFARWQALAWVFLFVTAPFSSAAMLLTRRPPPGGGPQGAMPAGCRAFLGALAAGLAVVAVLVWFDETRDSMVSASPVDLVRLTGTYLGAWCSFLAVLCGFAAVSGRWAEGRVALVGVVAAALGAVLAFMRIASEIRHPVPAVTVPLLLAACASGFYVSAARAVRPTALKNV